MHLRICVMTAHRLLMCQPVPTEDGRPTDMSNQARKPVRPMMELRIKQLKRQNDQDLRRHSASEYNVEIETHALAVLENRTHVGDDALAYLHNVYPIVALGEKLVGEALSRGKRMLLVIQAFRECRPAIGLESFPACVIGA